MKPLLVLARITFVGCLWSIIFIEGIRVIVLENWRFDIFWPPHWAYAWNLWQSGWVIDTRKEWAFILILVTFIPLWLMGWIALSLVPWETIIYRIIAFPFKLFKKSVQPIAQVVGSTPVITKKKSYKEIRPQGKRVPIYDYTNTSAQKSTPAISQSASQPSLPAPSDVVKDRAVSARETLNHTIFDLDDEDDDFDLDIDSFDKSDIFKIDSNKKKKESPAFENVSYERSHSSKEKSRTRDFEYDSDDEDLDDMPRQRRTKQAPKNMRYNMDDEDDEDLEDYEPAFSSPKVASRQKKRFEDDAPKYEKVSRRSEREQRGRTVQREKSFKSSGESISDLLEENGYDVLRNIPIGKNTADYLAVSADKILVCVVDKEQGDWLADEERFNDEEPLWFSENSHRISPVRKVDMMSLKIEKALENANLEFEIIPYVIITSGNIINAEDMIDVWESLDVKVVRFASGNPTDLMPLSKALKPTEESIDQEDFAKLKKVLKKLG